MLPLILAVLVLASWVGNALYCSTIIKRAFKLPAADEETVIARYSRRGRRDIDMAKLKAEIPRLASTVPGLRWNAIVPASISAMFALNGVTRLVWFKDGTAGVWFAVALIFLPGALTLYLMAWEQALLLARLTELERGPSGMRVADARARLAAEREKTGSATASESE